MGPVQAPLIGGDLGGYHILDLIGRGAVSAVYLARDPYLDRHAAVKVLLGSLARDPSILQSFHHEAQIAAPLKHPNIVRIYSAGEEGDTPYIAMEYVRGGPLDRFLERVGKTDWRTALCIGGQVAAALECVHDHGIIHRDVKPGNLLLDQEGRVRLTDFGIAIADHAGCTPLDFGAFVGTPQYLSPEQCAGGRLNSSSDLFSLGVTLYRLIAGKLPFEAESPVELINQICTSEPPRLNRLAPDVPDDVARLVAHLLQKRPEDRPGSAREVCETVERLQGEQGGRSVWPATLTAFIRSEGHISLPSVAGEPSRSELCLALPQERPRPSKLRKRIMASAAVLAFLFGAVWAFRAQGHQPAPAVKAAAVEQMAFTAKRRRTLEASLPFRGYRFTGLSWVGDKPIVAVRVQGTKGTLSHGASGLIAVAPGRRQCLALRAPSCPLMDSSSPLLTSGASPCSTVPIVPPDSPLRDSCLMLGRVRRQGGVSLALLPQPWDRAAPEHTVLYGTSSRSPGPSLYDEAACLHAAPNPDGHTLCLVLKDGAQNCNYLAERDIRWEPMDRIGVPLTSPGHTIVPDSVQYSPEGTLISYMRRKRDRRELWVVASGGSETDGVTLAVGSLGRYSAFSPDGRYMAVDVTEPGRPEPVVLLIDVATRAVEAQLGPGCLGKEPWHPSGDLLLVTHRSESQNDQMWAVETAPPHRRSRLTSVSGGIDPGCALSRCGTWAAGVVANSEHPTLILVDMRPVSFRNAT